MKRPIEVSAVQITDHQDFFLKAGTDYLLNRLGYAQFLKKPTKLSESYLGKIIEAIKEELRLDLCKHDRLNEDGICRACGFDCRGIGGS